tara:strand:+ start:178 stop:546 length:369 start_codon:yes stop_codon:yes gene_type:complete
MTEPKKISDGEKWQLLELFKEFFNEISLSKNHLVSIEKNIQEEIHVIFDKFKVTLSIKSSKRKEEIDTQIDDLEIEVKKRIRKLEHDVLPMKFWINSVKWFFGIVFTSLCVFIFTYLGKVLG